MWTSAALTAPVWLLIAARTTSSATVAPTATSTRSGVARNDEARKSSRPSFPPGRGGARTNFRRPSQNTAVARAIRMPGTPKAHLGP